MSNLKLTSQVKIRQQVLKFFCTFFCKVSVQHTSIMPMHYNLLPKILVIFCYSNACAYYIFKHRANVKTLPHFYQNYLLVNLMQVPRKILQLHGMFLQRTCQFFVNFSLNEMYFFLKKRANEIFCIYILSQEWS